MLHLKRLVTGAAFLLACQAGMTYGAIITLDVTTRGRYTEAGSNGAAGSAVSNYITGTTTGTNEFRSYFVFDLSSVTMTITDAELFADSYTVVTGDTNETLSIKEVTTSIATVTSFNSGQTGIFDDLGDGTTYGSIVFDNDDDTQTFQIALNSDFITAANNTSGSIALGGSITTLSVSSEQIAFKFSGAGEASDVQLKLTVVPQPAAIWFAVPMLGFLLTRRARILN